jgi:hypothetical protein
MKIGIFGNSPAKWKDFSGNIREICLLVENHFPNYQINWYGVGHASQERTVKLIQEHGSFDLCIVFHSLPECVYCPRFNNDFHIHDLEKAANGGDITARFGKLSNLYDGHIADFEEIFKTYTKFWMPDEKDLQLRFKANLIMLKMLLKNKNVVHVAPNYPSIKNLLNYGRYSKVLSHLVLKNGSEKDFASAFINEIELSESSF